MSLSDGQTFARYRTLRLRGFGGMAVVYLAKHPGLPSLEASLRRRSLESELHDRTVLGFATKMRKTGPPFR
jgi:hypothetical protein